MNERPIEPPPPDRSCRHLGLRLHPDKTKVVDLREGREGMDFLGGCMTPRQIGDSVALKALQGQSLSALRKAAASSNARKPKTRARYPSKEPVSHTWSPSSPRPAARRRRC